MNSIKLILLLSCIAAIVCFILYNKLKNKLLQEANLKCEQELAESGFSVSKCIEIPCQTCGFCDIRYYTKFLVDDANKKFAIFHYKRGKSATFKEFKYSDLLDFNMYENGEQQIEGRGLFSTVGALTFGVTGAVIGSAAGNRKVLNRCNELSVHLQVNDLQTPFISIVCVNQCDNKHSSYIQGRQIAEDIIATLTYIANNRDNSVKEGA